MKKYYKDYKPADHLSQDGKKERIYEYTGDYYFFPMNKEEKYKIFIKSIIYNTLYILLIVLGGLVNNGGSRSFFIAVPYVFLYLPAVYVTVGTAAVPKMKEKMEKALYDKAIGRINRCCTGILVLSFYLCCADAVFMGFMRKNIAILNETVFLCINGVLLFIAAVHKRDLQKMGKKVMIGKHENGVPIGK